MHTNPLPLAAALIRAAVATEDLREAVRAHVHENGESAVTRALIPELQACLTPEDAITLLRALLEVPRTERLPF